MVYNFELMISLTLFINIIIIIMDLGSCTNKDSFANYIMTNYIIIYILSLVFVFVSLFYDLRVCYYKLFIMLSYHKPTSVI